MDKSNYALLSELKEVLRHSKKKVTMAYFDEEDELLLKRIAESEKSADSMHMSYEKMHTPFTI